jgi:hypothetical protein
VTPDEQEVESLKYSTAVRILIPLRSGRFGVAGPDRKILGYVEASDSIQSAFTFHWEPLRTGGATHHERKDWKSLLEGL